ncbi:RagB/SusD family nutrient uptake outer membrane protein [Capnocytophaga cynodegmi]|uniref:RagB/SusD family nutrient uptake outer membrane protein n=1 Tax=Capnocytophaga cynodegmi TaxID=28189 RepID=A0A250E8P3_9FLAO|nr:RagB/SusD family nutrient uptake outer membrane protein [Capnocytophaga cynodegmi]ATA68087.1 RagB/SusD family nutrient uptake outer membrane protein [Capnocytophaga cynodegmi]
MKNIIYALIITIGLYSCDIDRFPHGSMSSEKIKGDPDGSLDGLLNGCYAQMKGWSDVMHRCGEYAGDNMMIRGSSTDAFYEFISYSRTPINYRLQSFWDSGYKVIAQASNIIKLIPEETASDETKSKLGECYFLRGMMYFYLSRAYGRPYSQSPETNLGVPIVNGTPDDLVNLTLPDRATVKETYEQAIKDLTKAEELITRERGNAYASKEAAQALLSRVYLYMSGTYENPNTNYAQLSVDYASKVINSGKYSLLDRQSFMRYNTLTPENNKESIFVVKRVATEFSGYDHYYGIGGMYANIGGMGWGEMYASAKYIDLLNETGRNDWANRKIVDARASFIEPQYEVPVDIKGYNEKHKQKVFRFIHKMKNEQGQHTGYGYIQAPLDYDYENNVLRTPTCFITTNKVETPFTLKVVDVSQGMYSIEYEGEVYQGVIDDLMKLNRAYPMFYITKCSREGEDSHLHSPVISRLAEVYLNRAEANAKLGRYGEALTDLNTIRERSIIGGGYPSLDASNASELIDKERQLELAFQAERSYDVFRNGKPLKRHYPGPHNALQDISADDYRVVYYIPQTAINSYPGTLTQNPTK